MIGLITVMKPLAILQQANPANTGDQIGQQIAIEAIRHQSVTNVIVPVAFFALILAVVYVGSRKRLAQIRARAEFHKQLLDKFGSGREFAEFLESKGSQRFLDELWSQGVGTKQRILNTMRNGIVSAALGLGLLGLALMHRQFLIPAVLLLALGVGFLVATGISYRLSKQWGEDQGPGQGNAAIS
jgi:threonine/homoserine efflux transporter RhtA